MLDHSALGRAVHEGALARLWRTGPKWAADWCWRRSAVRPGSFVAPWLTVVRWRPAGGRLDRTLVLLPDAAGSREMRNIRVILRWG